MYNRLGDKKSVDKSTGFGTWASLGNSHDQRPPFRNRNISTPVSRNTKNNNEITFGQMYGGKRKGPDSDEKDNLIDRYCQTDFDHTARVLQSNDGLLAKSIQLNSYLLKSNFRLVQCSGLTETKNTDFKNFEDFEKKCNENCENYENFLEVDEAARKDVAKNIAELSDQFCRLESKYDKMESFRKEQVKSLICLLELVLEENKIGDGLKKVIGKNMNRFKETVTINEEESSSSSLSSASGSEIDSDTDLKVVINGNLTEKEDNIVGEIGVLDLGNENGDE